MKKFVQFLQIATVMTSISLITSQSAYAINLTITFDDLPNLGATDQSLSFEDANAGSGVFNGVTFGSPQYQFGVTGDNYRIGGSSPNPTFGVPYSGHFFLNNRETVSSFITTTYVLTEAWFGRNEYYGYGGGATSVTVTALGNNVDLGSVTTALPDTFPYTGNLPAPNGGIGNGLPDPMVRLDTSSFLGLTGITGYRIDRVPNGNNGNWVADDFTFSAVAVPWETDALSVVGTTALFGLGVWSKTRSAKTGQK